MMIDGDESHSLKFKSLVCSARYLLNECIRYRKEIGEIAVSSLEVYLRFNHEEG